MTPLSRRSLLSGMVASGASLGLAGCVTGPATVADRLSLNPEPKPAPVPVEELTPLDSLNAIGESQEMYAALPGDKFPVPAINLKRINPAFLRADVAYDTSEPAGTIIVDTRAHYLYHVLGGGRARRYGVGVGRQGFTWSGEATINFKREWPDWYPPKEMIERQPEIKAKMSKLQSGVGMHGGPGNPLGARAMYLWQNNRDTLFRIHGTVEPWTIGKSVSSGCVRMINQDVIDLFASVAIGTRVIVLGPGGGNNTAFPET